MSEVYEIELLVLDTVPGISARTAEILPAETGTDMDRFPSAKHLSSWAGRRPGNNELTGKRTMYRRLAPRRGTRKALAAVDRAILGIVYHVLKRGAPDQDLEANYFDERDQQNVQHRLVKRLEQ